MLSLRTIKKILKHRATYGDSRSAPRTRVPTGPVFLNTSTAPYHFEYQICHLTGEMIVARVERASVDS